MRPFAAIVASALMLTLGCGTASGLSLQPIGNFDRPVSVTSAPADPERLLIAERDGRVVEFSAGASTEIADLTSLVSCCVSERGVLSIALAPDFGSLGRFYVAYTGTPAAGGAEGDVHVDSIRPDPGGGGALLREPILAIPHASDPNHNGGQLQFGPDGYLYVSTGDGGGTGDPDGNGQDLDSLLGKILRLDPRPGEVPAYAIPPGNPFASDPGRDEIWSLGLRNPWRFSFDAASGDLVIGDVGQAEREEVDFAPSPAPGVVGGAGENYGWNCREGLIAYPAAPLECAGLSGFTAPVFDYVHQDPAPGAASGCSVIGGYVSRDPGVPELLGRYVYSDFCSGELRSLVLPAGGGGVASDDRAEGPVVERPATFGEDAARRLYLATTKGNVYRLVGTASQAGAATQASAVAQVRLPLPRLLLRARKLGEERARIVARLTPCAGYAGEQVQLNRGGKRVGVRRLNRRCRGRFEVRVSEAATFRAFLREAPRVRSQQLVVKSSSDDG